jgi:prephenate dehydratase
MKVGIQGGPASFHEMAAFKYFGESIGEIIYFRSFSAMIRSLKGQHIDAAVMAIENTVAGSILPNYALLEKYGCNIIGEVYLRIALHLMTLKPVSIDQIRRIISHPMAILQSQDFLDQLSHPVEIIEDYDTADAAKKLRENGWEDVGVIASSMAAYTYNLHIIESEIETHKQNFTRFLVLNESGLPQPSHPNKASISFQLISKVGALADVLQIFKNHRINLTKIQSLPIIGKPYEYAFHVDLTWEKWEHFQNAIKEIRSHVISLKKFGEYREGRKEQTG